MWRAHFSLSDGRPSLPPWRSRALAQAMPESDPGRPHANALSPATAPDLVGSAMHDARRVARQAGLSTLIEERAASRGLWGTVLDQRPAPGALLQDGTVMALVVGAKPHVVVPDLRGCEEDVALAILRQAGLGTARRAVRASKEVPEGYVVRTRPRAGADVALGSHVSYVVAAGPRPGRPSRRQRYRARVGRMPDGSFLSLPEQR